MSAFLFFSEQKITFPERQLDLTFINNKVALKFVLTSKLLMIYVFNHGILILLIRIWHAMLDKSVLHFVVNDRNKMWSSMAFPYFRNILISNGILIILIGRPQ